MSLLWRSCRTPRRMRPTRAEYLAGNQMYQDLRGYGWPDVARALALEHRLIAKLQEAEDLEAEAMQIDDERLDCFEPSDGLWGLDLGVASATIALSAFGAIPVAKLQRRRLRRDASRSVSVCRVLHWRSGPGNDYLDSRDSRCRDTKRYDGVAQIFGAGDLSLLRFAETALNIERS